MQRTIIDLWNGHICPWEQCGEQDPQAQCLLQMKTRIANELTASNDQLALKYISCSEEYLDRMLELAFAVGFQLATKLLAESLVE